MNWNDENIKQAIADFKQKGYGTLADLKLTLEGITGVPISRMTLSRRLQGISTHDKGGRPSKQLQVISNISDRMQVS